MEGVKSFMREILGAPNYGEVLQAQVGMVRSMLSSVTSINMTQADAIVKAIKTIGWDSETQKELLAKVGEMTIKLGVSSKKQDLQDFKAFANYLKGVHWKDMNDDEISDADKLAGLLEHSASLTLRKGSEPSYQLLTALHLWATKGFDHALKLSGRALYNENKFIKKKVKEVASRRMNPAADVMCLPCSPRTLRAERRLLYDTVFSDAPPVACPLDANMLERLVIQIPMRSTNKKCKAEDENGGAVNNEMMMMMQRMCMKMMESRERLEDGSRLDFLEPSKKRCRRGSMDRPLALEDMPREERPPTLDEVEGEREDKRDALPADETTPKLEKGLTLQESRQRILAGLGFNADAAKKKEAAEFKKKKKGTTAATTAAKATPVPKAKAKTKTATRGKPHFSMEHSREQVMCRTGGKGPGSTHAITFKMAGGEKKAMQMAKAWVKKQLAEGA